MADLDLLGKDRQQDHHVSIRQFPIYGDQVAARELLSYIAKYRDYEIGPAKLYCVQEGLAVGSHFLVLDNERLIAASSRGIKSLVRTPVLHEYVPKRYRVQDGASWRRFDEPVLVVGGKASGAFFHWMVEIVPRLLMAKAAGRGSMPILLRPLSRDYERETLKLLGIAAVQVAEDVISAPEIWFPSHMVLPKGKGCMSPDLIALSSQVAALVPNAASEDLRRFYISRGDAPKRRVRNEGEVIGMLGGYGFRPVRLSELPLASQIRLFKSAEAVVAPHGGGLASLVYCRPGTKVVELYAAGFEAVSPFWNIASLAGLHYAMLLVDADLDKNGSYHNGDMVVDSALLRAVLDEQRL